MVKKILGFTLGVLVLLFGILLYSRFLGTIGLKTNEILVSVDIPDSYEGLKIVHFSDLHYKKVITKERVENLVEEINRLKPDLVLFTGDLVDGDSELENQDINFLIEVFSKIESKYGNYAVLGDQDESHLDIVKNIYIQSNFILLENDYAVIHNENNDQLFIGGIDAATDEENLEFITNYFATNEEVTFKIMLAHEPDVLEDVLETMPSTSLFLAGHSLNGSVNVPGIKKLLLPNGAKRYYEPHYRIGNTEVYISNGIGVNRINFRLWNTPSINFYRIEKQ